MLSWLAVLVALAAAAPRTGGWGVLVAAAALYRLQDLVLSTLDDALDLTGRFSLPGWLPDPDQADRTRSKVIIALVNIMQIVLVFAIVIGVFTSSSDWTGNLDSSRFRCFVLSWGGLVPFGVSANAVHRPAQVISIVESAVAVLILLVAFQRFLSPSDD